MNIEFIKKENNTGLILVFGGWSTEPSFYSDLTSEGWDTLAVTSYDDFNFPCHLLDSYSTVILIAWSMGVAMASRALKPDKITEAIAINGTLTPVSDSTGIPSSIFKGTAENLSETNLLKFRKRMCGKEFSSLSFPPVESDDINRLKSELKFFISSFPSNISQNSLSSHPSLEWTRAYISENDLIFPPENQKKFWQSFSPSTEIITLPSPHLPDFKTILKSLILPRHIIARKFEKALLTYDSNAGPQQEIARELLQLAPECKCEKILEIGPGTGYFSALMAKKFKPDEIDFVELYPLLNFNLASFERYFVADAEKWTDENANLMRARYDAVVSASAIQWFINPERFFRNCSVILKKSGFILISTFSTGNLYELRGINPYPILYRDPEILKARLSRYFKNVEIKESEIKVEFKNKKDTLLHLSRTGVGASIKSERNISEMPLTLTYKPLYLFASNPKN